MEVVLKISFLILSNADIQFCKKELTWRSYTTAEALHTTKWVELINKKEFVKTSLNEKSNTFVVHVVALESPLVEMSIHSDKKAQISFLLTEKVMILDKYSDFADVFWKIKL